MSRPEPMLLFTVSNHHNPKEGQPPTLNGDDPNTYHGYFENSYGEQSLFVHNRKTGQTALFCGDAGWQSYPVRNGRVEGLLLDPEEQRWLEACWLAVTRHRATR